jgi:hypothetical protein
LFIKFVRVVRVFLISYDNSCLSISEKAIENFSSYFGL